MKQRRITMKIKLLAILLLLPFTVAAQPDQGMVGKKVPASFLLFIPFKDHITRCIGADAPPFDLLVRTYTTDGVPFRMDTFKYGKLISHYLPFEKKLYHLDKAGVIDRVVEMERFFPAQHCEVGRME